MALNPALATQPFSQGDFELYICRREWLAVLTAPGEVLWEICVKLQNRGPSGADLSLSLSGDSRSLYQGEDSFPCHLTAQLTVGLFFFPWTMFLLFYLALFLNKYHTGVADF